MGCNNDWELRIINHDVEERKFGSSDKEAPYSIQEVRFAEDGLPDIVSVDFQIQGTDLEHLKNEVAEINDAMSKPIINESSILTDPLDVYDTDSYAYNTEFGGDHTHEEMNEIDINNQRLHAIAEMIKNTPNNMELGKIIRSYYWAQTEDKGGEQLELFEDNGE
jgi:hypothetical protein